MKKQKLTYGGYHKRVNKVRGKPNKCEHCNTTVAKRFEWASVSKNYKDVFNYIRLCSRCHFKFDKRINNLFKDGKVKTSKKECKKCKRLFTPETGKQVYCGIPEKTGCSRLNLLEYKRKQYHDYKEGIRYS